MFGSMGGAQFSVEIVVVDAEAGTAILAVNAECAPPPPRTLGARATAHAVAQEGRGSPLCAHALRSSRRVPGAHLHACGRPQPAGAGLSARLSKAHAPNWCTQEKC
jgi:hypothetical protein